MRFLVLLLLLSKPVFADTQSAIQDTYEKAYSSLLKENFGTASKNFDILVQKYPYFTHMEYAMPLRLYSKYRDEQHEEVDAAAKDFFALYPKSEYLPYVAYVAGMTHYDQVRNVMWDQGNLKKAKDAFIRLIQLFPNTDYALDALLRLEFIKSHEALKILRVGLFYQDDTNYPAAISRYNKIVWNYSRTIYVREALYRLVESYISLGLNDEAYNTALVLGYNFPNSHWYYKSYNLLHDRDLIGDT